MDSQNLMEQADSVWKMLNELADSDPEAYQKFISKSLKEGADQSKPPQPCFCISTVMLPEVVTHKVYINICGWDQIPGPKTDQDPIPVMAGAVQEITIDNSTNSIVDVIFNANVLRDIEQKKDHRNLLVHLALDYLQETKQIQVSRKYKTLKAKYKGNSSNLNKYLKTGAKEAFESTHPSASSAPMNKVPLGTKDTLLNQLSSIAVHDSNDKDIQGISLFEDTKGKTGLIEEISSSEESVPKNSVLQVPKYEVIIKELDGGVAQLVSKIDLPGVSSVNQCELEVSEDDLLLEVPSLYRLHLDLPKKVDDTQVTASFNKTTQRLIVKLPILE